MTNTNPADMDTPVIPQKRVLRNRFGYDIADLLDPADPKKDTKIPVPIASGAFGEIWLARLRNPLSLLARRVVLGEEDSCILGLNIPFTGQEITDTNLVKHVYDAAQKDWQKINENKLGIKKGIEEYKNYVKSIDPTLLENPYIAVKVLKPRPQDQSPEEFQKHLAETRVRFKQESDLLKRFAHPNAHKNIIRRYSLVNDPDWGKCLLQEWIEGETLEERLNTQEGHKLPPKTALDIACQLADAIMRIHAEGVIHRDLKPSNIMLRKSDGSPVIIDFGISKGEDSNLTMDKIIGTPRYMAPEQLTTQADARADIYALSTILFEMIAGAAAYPYAGHAAVIEKLKQPTHPTRIVQYARNIHPFLRQLIESGRAKDPDNRLSDEEFLDAAKELISIGKFYQDAPLGASSTIIKKERSRALRRIKMTQADVRMLEQELQSCTLNERISGINQFLKEEEFTRAQEEIAALQKELTELPERDEELQSQLDKYTESLKQRIALREANTYVAKASEARKSLDYVALGDLLEQAERALSRLSEQQRAASGEVCKSMRKDYEDNFKWHVEKFKPARDHLNSAQAEYVVLEHKYAAHSIAQGDVDSLLKKVGEAEDDLKGHKNPDKVGPAYDAALADAAELRKKANKLSAFANVMGVLNKTKEKYDALSALYAKNSLVDVKPMDELLTQLDALMKDLPIFEPSRKGVLYETATTYAKDSRDAIADLRTRTAPKA